MEFSLILPVYNVELYFKPCIESLIGQSFSDFEVILVDDGSTDSSGKLCDEYAALDSRIRVVHQLNCGQASARNTGLDCATGDYVFFIDSDDFLKDENVLEKLHRCISSRPDVVHFKFVEWFESGGYIADCRFNYNVPTKGRSVAEIYCDLIDKDSYYNSAWSKIIRRDLLLNNNIRFEEGIVGEDNEWYYHIVMVANSLVLMNESFYVYRRRQGSTTTSTKRKNLVDQLYVLDKWTTLLQNKDDDRARVVKGSLAKQFCSAVIIYAGLTGVSDLYPHLKDKSFLLKYSKTKRVVLFRWIKGIVGLKGLIIGLRLIKKLH